MVGCHEMKASQVYVCEECGTEDAMCELESCSFVFCGEPLKLKED
jgi:hypothetical protein